MILVAVFAGLLLIGTLQKVTTDTVPAQAPHKTVEYEQLDVLQSYPVHRLRTDQPFQPMNTCNGLSGYREVVHSSAFYDRSVEFQRVSKPCYSVLRNCRSDEAMEYQSSFCKSRNPHRRYDFANMGHDGKYVHYGINYTDKCEEGWQVYQSKAMYYACVCDCENMEKEADRYFSLLDVLSDNDKVVTGLRFRKIDHVFYIQIEQATLGPKTQITGEVFWKDVETVSHSDLLSSNVSEYYKTENNNDNLVKFHENKWVYAVTSDQNTVLLDNLSGELHEVITGLRFRHVGNDLGLEIQVTPFDEETGKLETGARRWVNNYTDSSKRSEANLQSIKAEPCGPKFVKFRVSDFVTDLGQTTIPLIDMVNIVSSSKPQPFFGAGIYHNPNRSLPGFIGFRALTRNGKQGGKWIGKSIC